MPSFLENLGIMCIGKIPQKLYRIGITSISKAPGFNPGMFSRVACNAEWNIQSPVYGGAFLNLAIIPSHW
jgi:hypothetical protein